MGHGHLRGSILLATVPGATSQIQDLESRVLEPATCVQILAVPFTGCVVGVRNNLPAWSPVCKWGIHTVSPHGLLGAGNTWHGAGVSHGCPQLVLLLPHWHSSQSRPSLCHPVSPHVQASLCAFAYDAPSAWTSFLPWAACPPHSAFRASV